MVNSSSAATNKPNTGRDWPSRTVPVLALMPARPSTWSTPASVPRSRSTARTSRAPRGGVLSISRRQLSARPRGLMVRPVRTPMASLMSTGRRLSPSLDNTGPQVPRAGPPGPVSTSTRRWLTQSRNQPLQERRRASAAAIVDDAPSPQAHMGSVPRRVMSGRRWPAATMAATRMGLSVEPNGIAVPLLPWTSRTSPVTVCSTTRASPTAMASVPASSSRVSGTQGAPSWQRPKRARSDDDNDDDDDDGCPGSNWPPSPTTRVRARRAAAVSRSLWARVSIATGKLR